MLEWQIFDKPGGGDDRYQVIITGGTCSVEKDGEHAPRVTFKLKPVRLPEARHAATRAAR